MPLKCGRDTFNTVTKENLTGTLISGNLTSSICGIPNLTVLILQHNAFSGSFPHGLFRCKRFRKLNLSENQFAGRLPRGSFLHGLFHCKRLQKLDFSSNGFAGKLPSRICELSDLRELKLANNVFSGSIPPAFGMLPKLKALFLNKNKLNGKFNVLQNLKSLAIFWIDSNPLLPGAVPRWIGDSRQPWQLGLENCKLVVGIPYFFGNLTQLQRLYLSHNRLWGNIPTSLMELSSLKQLALNYNNVSGEIPDNIHQLRSLTTLDLSHNGLSGRIPSELQWPSGIGDRWMVVHDQWMAELKHCGAWWCCTVELTVSL
ncbi:hypothetical protein SUGI_1083830 [Cryptomeria japonica]|nr:hypothetical protein SUGI_1083830 [Cryptomeria japonica]